VSKPLRFGQSKKATDEERARYHVSIISRLSGIILTGVQFVARVLHDKLLPEFWLRRSVFSSIMRGDVLKSDGPSAQDERNHQGPGQFLGPLTASSLTQTLIVAKKDGQCRFLSSYPRADRCIQARARVTESSAHACPYSRR
jgi:hypothetical protein